jgi:hypothetical protein
MKASSRGKIVRFVLLLGFACVPLKAEAAADSLAALDAQLLRGDWDSARSAALALIADDLAQTDAAPLAGAVARLALAEAGLGREEDALWHWRAAQNLDRSALSPQDLAAYGEPGELLARHPLRRADEAPAGLRVLRSEDPGVRPAVRLAGSIPPPSAAASSVLTAHALRLQVLITADGRLTEPVVLAGNAPGATYEILESLRAWRYQPALQSGRPVAVFRTLTISISGGWFLTGIAAQDRRLTALEGLIREGSWQRARDSARGLWRESLESPTVTPWELAALLALRSLSEAGLGLEPEAVCRWQAALYVAPRLRDADLSIYGDAGALLARNAQNPAEEVTGTKSGTKSGTKNARIAKDQTFEIPRAAQRAPMTGQVVLGVTIDPRGAVRQPLVVRVEDGPDTVLAGLDSRLDPGATDPNALTRLAAAKLLAFSALDAVCDWRFQPAAAGDPDPQRLVTLPFSWLAAPRSRVAGASPPRGPLHPVSAPDPQNLPTIVPIGPQTIQPPR